MSDSQPQQQQQSKATAQNQAQQQQRASNEAAAAASAAPAPAPAPAPAAAAAAAAAAASATAANTPPPLTHGYAFEQYWAATFPQTPLPKPKVLTQSEQLARPGYSNIDCSEYGDSAEVIKAKVDFLLNKMMPKSEFKVFYIGAGCSTAAIGDYASRASGSVVKAPDNVNRLHIPPTMVHRILTAWNEKMGKTIHLLNQNHDRLMDKAGWPSEGTFEYHIPIHGAWGSNTYRVLMMDEKLHPYLFDMMLQWFAAADFVLAMGTSLSGMTSDTIVEAVHRKHRVDGIGAGAAIMGLQRTKLDHCAALRFYGRLEVILEEVKRVLKLRLDTKVYDPPRLPAPPRQPAAAPAPKPKPKPKPKAA